MRPGSLHRSQPIRCSMRARRSATPSPLRFSSAWCCSCAIGSRYSAACAIGGLRSRPADELRALLPRELAAVAADVRLVEGSSIAAASGVLRPTIWLGDRHTDVHRTLVLVHELWHVRARDPAWLLAIAAVRRAYWWNPLVAYLARQAVLMIESTCDHRCAVQFGKAAYVARARIAAAGRCDGARAASRCDDRRVES